MNRRVFQMVMAMMVVVLGADAQEHPDLGNFESFKERESIWMGSMIGEVSVDPEVELQAVLAGEIEWKVEDGAEVAEGDVVAICGVEKLRLSERDLNIRRARFRNDMLDCEQSNRESRKSLVGAMREAEDRLASMVMTKGERELLGGEFEQRLEKERSELREQIARHREKLDGDYFEVALASAKQALQLDLDRAEADYRDMMRRSEMLAPVDGVVHVRERGTLRSVGPVGAVERRGVAELVVEITNPELRSMEGELLEATVRGTDGRWYSAEYQEVLENEMIAGNTRRMSFAIHPTDDVERVPKLLSGKRGVRIYRRLDEPGRVVPKADLLFRFPEEIRENGWAGFVESRWSGVRVVYVGPRDLVVKRVDEN
ncbi:MAG: hypothetical protein ACQCXQ_00840 [Verrucomicrobiales bacterium]|nr:hypothetical protein [Verrucomicrobiota bacterium JB025]